MFRESISFRPHELVFDFFVIPEMCIYFRVISQLTTFAIIISYFFGDFSVIKARKLHQTRSKTCPFEAFAGGGLTSNHSDSEPGEP